MLTVLRNGIVIAPENGQPVGRWDWDVAIEDRRIAFVGPAYPGAFDRELDCRGHIVSPGFVNGHVHSFLIPVLRGLSEDDPRDRTMYGLTIQALAPAIGALTRGDQLALTEWALAEQLLGGVTAVVENALGPMDVFIEASDRLPIRAWLSQLFNDITGGDASHSLYGDGTVNLAGLRQAVSGHERFDGRDDGRVRVTLGPHAPDTCAPELLEAIRQEADRLDCPVVIHVCQGHLEVEEVQSRHGCSPVEYLDRAGLVRPRTLMAHAFLMTDDDEQLVAQRGAAIAHCPVVIAKRGMPSRYSVQLKRGIPVAIGTDSYGGNVLDQLKTAAFLGKAAEGISEYPTAEQVFLSATRVAAEALGSHDVGQLEVGARADIAVFDVSGPRLAPIEFAVRQLVYYGSAAPVRHVMVDGRLLVEDGMLAGVPMADLSDRALQAAGRAWDAVRSTGLVSQRQ